MRRARRSDRPSIAKFIEDAYGVIAPYKAAPRWTWQFIDNPFARSGGDEIPVWVAVDGDRVVGQIAVQMTLLQVDGKELDAGWAVDVMILPSHRGSGLGHRLHEAVISEVGILVSIKMAEASRRLAARHPGVTPTEVHQFTRWVRLDPVSARRFLMKRTANHRWAYRVAHLACAAFQFHRLFPLLANPVLRLRDAMNRTPRWPEATDITELDRFGPEIDQLWERTRSDYPVIVPRDARYLNWRFVDCPEPRYRCFVAQRGDQTVGYVVLRHAEPVELSQGIIVDVYASRTDRQTVHALVQHSLAFFGDTVPAVDCGTSDAELRSVLRKYGFVRTRTHHPTCVCQDSAVRDRLARLDSHWFLSRGDHDWDQIQLADPQAVAE